MRKPQIDQIKNAHNAYIICLNSAFTRFSVYMDSDECKLSVLWPSHDEEAQPAKKSLLPWQQYSKLSNFPAYHFYIPASEYVNGEYELATMLKRFNPDIQIFRLNGNSPGSISTE